MAKEEGKANLVKVCCFDAFVEDGMIGSEILRELKGLCESFAQIGGSAETPKPKPKKERRRRDQLG